MHSLYKTDFREPLYSTACGCMTSWMSKSGISLLKDLKVFIFIVTMKPLSPCIEEK